MHRLVSAVFAVGLSANGLFMLFGPRLWYHTIPNVTGTGPFNAHFVRDIGCAYLVAGLAAGWLALQRSRAWPATLAGGAFLGLHALVHVTDAIAGREPWGQVLEELPTVIAPAVVMFVLARPPAAPRVLGDAELEAATEQLAP